MYKKPQFYVGRIRNKQHPSPCLCPLRVHIRPALTSVVVQRGELGALVTTAGAVAGFHLQLVPGGLTQLGQEDVGRGVGAQVLPRPSPLGPEVQQDGRDGAAATGPALQV